MFTAPYLDGLDLGAPAPGALEQRFGTLLLDGEGRIEGCGTAGALVFGGSEVQMIGRSITDFIAELDFKDNRLITRSIYQSYLCTSGLWCTFNALNLSGQEMIVELSLSRVLSGADERVLVYLRRRDTPIACN